jgi:hypothetical protein
MLNIKISSGLLSVVLRVINLSVVVYLITAERQYLKRLNVTERLSAESVLLNKSHK